MSGSGWEEVYPRSRCRVPNAAGESAIVSARVGGVFRARDEVWAGVAGFVGKSLRGGGVRRPRKRPSLMIGVEKIVFAPAGGGMWLGLSDLGSDGSCRDREMTPDP